MLKKTLKIEKTLVSSAMVNSVVASMALAFCGAYSLYKDHQIIAAINIFSSVYTAMDAFNLFRVLTSKE